MDSSPSAPQNPDLALKVLPNPPSQGSCLHRWDGTQTDRKHVDMQTVNAVMREG